MSNKLEQLEFKLEKIYLDLETCRNEKFENTILLEIKPF